MPKNLTAQEADADERMRYRTGPNVDNGLEPGAVTVDPDTAHGRAAAANRDANGANTNMTDDGIAEVTVPGDDRSPKVADDTHVADPSAPAVDKQSAKAKAKTPNTIANTPDDIVADPKADVQ
jgi:hypothetical protein